jgi:hypothetical protein
MRPGCIIYGAATMPAGADSSHPTFALSCARDPSCRVLCRPSLKLSWLPNGDGLNLGNCRAAGTTRRYCNSRFGLKLY